MTSSPGSRNLIILGAGSLAITFITTSASLFVYKQSGDIYLDRSRPGYLPDKEEASEEAETTDFEFPESGSIDQSELKRYLEEYKKVNDRLKDIPDPYSPAPLSDASLGIPEPDILESPVENDQPAT